jgi:hypothetical protein
VRWPWRRDGNGAAKAAEVEKAKLRDAHRETPVARRLAGRIPEHELAERLRRAMTVRHP